MTKVTIIENGVEKKVNLESLNLPEPEKYIEPVPVITARQLRLWLSSRGITADQIVKLIKHLPADQSAIAMIEWEYATIFEHTHDFVQALGAAMGLTPDQIKDAFREAAKL